MPTPPPVPPAPRLVRPLGDLSTPCLLLDHPRFLGNVGRMHDRLRAFGVEFRPHLKTAKSIEVARRAMTSPSGPAMVSTLREAEYFAAQGVRDLIYGVGIAPAKLDRVGTIRQGQGADLAIILDSVEQADAVAGWSKVHGHPLPALIEIDADGHRSGVGPGEAERLVAIGRRLEQGGAILRGVLTHAGDSYSLNRPDRIVAAAAAEAQAVATAAGILRDAHLPCPVVSVGSTPTACFARDLSGVTEVRAGVFMFGDLVQAGIGACRVEDIAISVLATVIGHQHAKGWTIIDAGWMALSRDRGTSRQAVDQGYGLVCDEAGTPYPDLLVLDANQEHGVVGPRTGSRNRPPELPIGALVRILPNHACATGAQHEGYQVLSAEGDVVAEWPRITGW